MSPEIPEVRVPRNPKSPEIPAIPIAAARLPDYDATGVALWPGGLPTKGKSNGRVGV